MWCVVQLAALVRCDIFEDHSLGRLQFGKLGRVQILKVRLTIGTAVKSYKLHDCPSLVAFTPTSECPGRERGMKIPDSPYGVLFTTEMSGLNREGTPQGAP